jgi:hypothetical protein
MSNYDKNDSPLYCNDCLADTEVDCICNKIIGLDARTGYPIVDDNESDESREWALFWD